jgi:DNA-directed RNA polymerase specialized sigma24 family protein
LQGERTNALNRSLPQLYRFCFLMTGEATQALEAFQNTIREAALLAARGQLPDDRLWSFHEARHQCLTRTANTLGGEPGPSPGEAIAPDADSRVAQLQPEQLAAWIAATPEPQRSALAFFYLNEFSHREMQNLLDVKMSELANLISHGRAQFQAWLNAVTADPEMT